MQVATLGPSGTFSELAARKYLEVEGWEGEISLFPTITKTFRAAESGWAYCVIPIENLLDGFVHGALDLMVQTELNIIGELVLPVQFSFIGNTASLNDIKHVYVQFKSQGQCTDFLEPLMPKVITTESNATSFYNVVHSQEKVGAVVPSHLIERQLFPIQIQQVTDSTENETRFIILSKKKARYKPKELYKTSIVVTSACDEPGLLSTILGTFSKYKINLTSIMSRPTKKALGKYYFFIDFEGHYQEDERVRLAIGEIQTHNIVKILGSYTKL